MFAWHSAMPCRDTVFWSIRASWVSLVALYLFTGDILITFFQPLPEFSLCGIMKGSLCSMFAAAAAEGNGPCSGRPAALTSSATPNILAK